MPTLTTTAGAIALATDLKAYLVNAEVHLFQVGEIDITPNTPIAELTALEADYTGYAEAVVATWIGPLLAPVSGAQVQTPTLVFEIDAPYTVGNSIMGWWLQDAAGVLLMIGTSPLPIPFEGVGQGWPFSVAVTTGGNA